LIYFCWFPASIKITTYW